MNFERNIFQSKGKKHNFYPEKWEVSQRSLKEIQYDIKPQKTIELFLHSYTSDRYLNNRSSFFISIWSKKSRGSSRFKKIETNMWYFLWQKWEFQVLWFSHNFSGKRKFQILSVQKRIYWSTVRSTWNCSKKELAGYLVWKTLKYIKHRWKLYNLEILVGGESLHKLQYINNSVKGLSFSSVSDGVELSQISFSNNSSFVFPIQTGIFWLWVQFWQLNHIRRINQVRQDLINYYIITCAKIHVKMIY